MTRPKYFVQQMLFMVAVTIASRFFVLRDALLRRLAKGPFLAGLQVSRISIPSGDNWLDAVQVQSAVGPTHAALLICHGIGETVERWLGVQRLLAEDGVASLVFDY